MHETAPILRLRNVTKRFGAVVANDGISLDLRGGEVHCLLGENGAGKSTLISMLAGMLQPDTGEIEFDGVPCVLRTPADSLEKGIRVVYQHSALVPTMTVLENLLLTESRGFRLHKRLVEERLADLRSFMGAELPPDMPIGDLALGQQQQIEIAKALWSDPRVLVLDEPTSMLSSKNVTELMAAVRELADSGAAVLLVTHKLDEALAIGDRVTVLRNGRVTERIETDRLRESGKEEVRSRILAAMFGEVRPQSAAREARNAPAPILTSHPLLRLENVSTAESGSMSLRKIDLTVHAGETLGVAGIDGHGQRQLAEVIAGQLRATGGRIYLENEEITSASVRGRQQLGISYLTDDRLGEGIVGSLSTATNLLLKRVGRRPFWQFGHANRGVVTEEAERLIARYDVRPAAPDTKAGTLSGGNIQKLLLARELSGHPRIVVFSKPGYGLDSQTVERVRAEIRGFVAGGGAAIVISTDLDELTALSHRIAVLAAGELIGEVQNEGPGVRERIGALMSQGVRT